jgi:hypothetical protein
MNAEQIAEIESRAAAATPGPWATDEDIGGCVAAEHPDFRSYWTDVICITRDSVTKRKVANAVFIAHARTDIPALIAALRAAQARVSELEAVLTKIAAYDEGPVVTGRFDCPAHATEARAVLERK